MGELLKLHAALWLNAAVKATHVEEKVWIVLAVHRDEAHLPRNSCDGAGEAVLDVPEDSSTAGGGSQGGGARQGEDKVKEEKN